MKIKKKKITLEDLNARFDSVDKRFDELTAHIDIEIEDLAGMVKRRFDEQDRNIDAFKSEMIRFRDRTDKRLAMEF